MFLETADQNYISARAAFFDRRDWDFWWLALHATEKYLKAILLMNGGSAIGQGHDLLRLIQDVKALDGRITEPDFQGLPSPIGLFRSSRQTDRFMDRLAEYGSADNRYGTYGYQVSEVDLICFDRLAYWARRYATPFIFNNSGCETVDWVAALDENPRLWRHFAGPLEETLALKPSDRRRWPAARMNFAFLPTARHRNIGLRSTIHNPPINEWCARLVDPSAKPEAKERAYSVLSWLVDRVQLSRRDREFVVDLLRKHGI
jgi:hypothetical protein